MGDHRQYSFKRQLPMEEVESDNDEEGEKNQTSDSNEKNISREKRVKVDEDGTEYEWDSSVKGWFPKVSERYLIEHHMNYGLSESNGVRFDTDCNCYVYESPDGENMRLDGETNQWVPFDASIEPDEDGIRTFKHPRLNIKFRCREACWEPAEQSSHTDANTGLHYIWYSGSKSFVDSRCLTEYTDHLTGVTYRWSGTAWDIVDASEAVAISEQEKNGSGRKAAVKDKAVEKDGWLELPETRNCNVYVSGLPLDISDEEFVEMMTKYGVIATDPETDRPKVKLYHDRDGIVKGDGMCKYMKIESVELCLNLLDGYNLRGCEIKSERAKFQVKGDFENRVRRKKKAKKNKSRHQRLLGWNDEDDEAITQRPKHERIVVVENAFDNTNEMASGEEKALKHDMKQLFQDYADVKDVRIFPSDGVVTVALLTPEWADRCVSYLNNRVWKNSRLLSCQIWDGKRQFREDDDNESERICKWHSEIANT